MNVMTLSPFKLQQKFDLQLVLLIVLNSTLSAAVKTFARISFRHCWRSFLKAGSLVRMRRGSLAIFILGIYRGQQIYEIIAKRRTS